MIRLGIRALLLGAVLTISSSEVDAQFYTGAPSWPAFAAVVGTDTIWFISTTTLPTSTSRAEAVGFIRRTGMWTQAVVNASSRSESDFPRDPDASDSAIVVAQLNSRFSVVMTGDTVVQQAESFPGRKYAVRDERTGKLVPLRIPDTPANRRRLLKAGESRSEISPMGLSFATDYMVHATDARNAWFGMWAGPPSAGESENYRQRAVPTWAGGLLRFDFETQRVTALLHPMLRTHWVTSIALTSGAVWLGTDRFDFGDGPPAAGLLRYRLSDSSWARFSSGASPLPGNRILALTATADTLLIETDSGLAVVDTRRMKWNTVWFGRALRGDSIIAVLEPSRPKIDSLLRVTTTLAAALCDWRYGVVHAAVMRANRDTVLSILRPPRDDSGDEEERVTDEGILTSSGISTTAAALADTAFLDIVLRAFSGPAGEARKVASEALLAMRHPRAQAELRAVMDTAPVGRAVHIAGVLASRGDANARRWLHARLADPVVRRDTSWVDTWQVTPMDTLVNTLRALRDSTSVPALFELLDARSAEHAMHGILEMGTSGEQRELARRISARPTLWPSYLDDFTQEDYLDTIPQAMRYLADSALRESLLTISRNTLQLNDTALIGTGMTDESDRLGVRYDAIDLLAHWGRASDVGLLAELFRRNPYYTFDVAEGLVRLTGDASAPKADRLQTTDEQRRALVQFWTGWLSSHRGRFVRPDRSVAEKAVSDWRERHGL